MGVALQDPNGVREVGMKVHHLLKRQRGTVIAIAADNKHVDIECARGLVCRNVKCSVLETLYEYNRRQSELHRRRGGSRPQGDPDITREHWTTLEETYLRRADVAGVPLLTQARELERTREAVTNRRQVIGLTTIEADNARAEAEAA